MSSPVRAFTTNVRSLHTTSRWLHRSARQIASQLKQVGERVQQPHTARTPDVTSPVAAPTPSTPSIPQVTVQHFIETHQQVTRVDDPFCEMSLIAVRGEISRSAIDQLHESLSDLSRGRFVHLDLASSSIRTSREMQSLEAIADDLELRGIVLRVVGLDPQHPMLTPTL